MTYQKILNSFSESEYNEYIVNSLSHILDLNNKVDMNNDLFILCTKFKENQELEFYIELNNFFNNFKDIQNEIRTLILISASNNLLIENYLSIEKSFFIIHSTARPNIKYQEYGFAYEDSIHPCISLIGLIISNYLPKEIANYIFEHLTYTIAYAKKYSTEYYLIKHILDNIMIIPKFIDKLHIYAYNNIFCINFLIQLLEWCNENSKEDDNINTFNKLYYILDDIQEFTPSINYDIQIELCLFRFREKFKTDYNYEELADFYDVNIQNIPILHKLRILTQLFLKLDKEKYLDIYSNEISKINIVDLRLLIEQISPDVFSSYLINLGFNEKNKFINFLEKTYHCNKNILNATAFYFHSDDYTYILEKKQKQFDIIPELHSRIIDDINSINNLNITVKHESKYQKEEYNETRENVPIDHFQGEKNFIDSLKKYYHIDSVSFDDNIKYILLFQQIRVPIQQLLLKKYNKLFPFINIFNKIEVPIKKIDKIIHVVLSESSTLEQEEKTIRYLNKLNENIIFEYKYIDNFEEFMIILNSNEYSIISVTSHGKINTRNPLENQIKIGNEYIDMFRFQIDFSKLENKRLLYLNICDSGHSALKNGFMVESLSAQLIDNTQAVISNMWPINPIYSSTFLMLLFHHVIKSKNYKESYKFILSLAIDNKLNDYIYENNLYIDELELFRVFNDSSINKHSIVHWGALMYQE